MSTSYIVNDISGLNPTRVAKIVTPSTVEELIALVKNQQGAISISNGGYSMGGQIVAEDSLHIKMTALNKIINFNIQEPSIHVQAGITWKEIQQFIDTYDLAISIMQTYANFTVGGSLSVNAHGRYVGKGSLIHSVKAIKIVLANGEVVTTNSTEFPNIFYGSIGGYGSLGIIIEVVLELIPNTKIKRLDKKLNLANYPEYFLHQVRNNNKAVFHNADIYPPHYSNVRAITWLESEETVTIKHRIKSSDKKNKIFRYFQWAISSTPFGKWRREYLIDPVIYFFDKVCWRNYEASCYDTAELEPKSRHKNTFLLQEYFIPVSNFSEFLPTFLSILKRFQVNVLNISIRHCYKDHYTTLAWAREEVFCFVLYYKQATSELAQNETAIWTREVINAAIAVRGSYISTLKKYIAIKGRIYLISDQKPSYSSADILERGQLKKLGNYLPLNNYHPISRDQISDSSIDLVTCYIGLHHAPLEKLNDFIRSIHRILRSGGRLILREHDVNNEKMHKFVSLAHTVFNVGLGVSSPNYGQISI